MNKTSGSSPCTSGKNTKILNFFELQQSSISAEKKEFLMTRICGTIYRIANGSTSQPVILMKLKLAHLKKMKCRAHRL